MALVRLDVHCLRNLEAVSIEPGQGFNLFIGDNGSGKTSLLEAVHLLGLGRSFRTVRARRLIEDGKPSATVRGVLDDGYSLAVQKTVDGDSTARFNGADVSLSVLAHQLPFQLIDPLSLDMLSGPSQPRRQLMDWGVFHVEPEFLSAWQRAQRALQQRNSLLKSAKISAEELRVWEQELAASATRMHQLRSGFMARWQPGILAAFARLLPDVDISVSYVAGWDVDEPLDQALMASRGKDIERGFTHLGPHRADVRLRSQGMNADERLSRGQLKLAVCALKLSLLDVLSSDIRRPIVLLDDLASELDESARRRLCEWLQDFGVQAWLTAIEASALPLERWGLNPARKFHVEHGRIRPCDDTPQEQTDV